MTRWLFALAGAFLVTLAVALALGLMLLYQQAGPAQQVHSPTSEAVTAPAMLERPERPEIPVRHVYAVPRWDPGPAPPDWEPSFGQADIRVSAAPGEPARISRGPAMCTLRAEISADRLDLQAGGCLSPQEAAGLEQALSAWARTLDAKENAPRLVELTARLEFSEAGEN